MWTIVGIVVAGAALYLVGLLLPRDHVASVSVVIPKRADEVYARLRAVERAADWRTGVERVERIGELEDKPAYREHSSFGPLPYLVEEDDPPRRMVTRILDEGQGFGGSWVFELEPREGGTRVTLTERGEVYSPFFRVMSRVVFGHYATLEAYATDLAKSFGVETAVLTRGPS
jgi:hypothetical protein